MLPQNSYPMTVEGGVVVGGTVAKRRHLYRKGPAVAVAKLRLVACTDCGPLRTPMVVEHYIEVGGEGGGEGGIEDGIENEGLC